MQLERYNGYEKGAEGVGWEADGAQYVQSCALKRESTLLTFIYSSYSRPPSILKWRIMGGQFGYIWFLVPGFLFLSLPRTRSGVSCWFIKKRGRLDSTGLKTYGS